MATVRTLIGNVKGPKGDTGETGATGAAGAAATIDAGTVNTVAFGQPARVTNVGSQSAAVFNFDIPAGQPGSVGEISGYPVNAITTQPGDFPTPVVGDTIAAIVGKQAKATADAQTGIQNLNASVANILSDFATVETGANASKAYAVGDYLVKDGQFYRVTAAIAQGNALTVGGNIQATNVGAEVSALNNDLATSRYADVSLGTSFTAEQQAALAAGNMSMFPNGAYWQNGNRKWRIVDNTQPYLNKGDTAFNRPHLVIMSDDNILKSDGSTTKYMKDTNDTTGGYQATKYRQTYRAQCKQAYTSFFGASHIATFRDLQTSAVASGHASSWSWVDADVELPSEVQIYGSNVWQSDAAAASLFGHDTGISFPQFALFRLAPKFITNRENYWLRNVVSASYFAIVNRYGGAHTTYASNTAVGLRPFALLV